MTRYGEDFETNRARIRSICNAMTNLLGSSLMTVVLVTVASFITAYDRRSVLANEEKRKRYGRDFEEYGGHVVVKLGTRNRNPKVHNNNNRH